MAKTDDWDTNEVCLQVMNDEYLYLETEDVTHRGTMREIVQPYLTELHGRQYINFGNVDWDEVIEVRTEEVY